MTPVITMTGTTVTTTNEKRSTLFNLVMNNVKRVGAKTYAYIPVELLFADDLFQRKTNASKKKIKKLAEKWNINKKKY